MAETLGIVAGIVAVSELATSVACYIERVRNASDDVKLLRQELANISHILYQLHDLTKTFSEFNVPFPTIQMLQGREGPLEQFKQILEALCVRLGLDDQGFKYVYRSISWPLRKHGVKDLLTTLERYKILFLLALGNDQIRLMEALREDFATQQQKVLIEIAKIGVAQSEQSRRDNDQEKQDIISWVSPLDFLQTQNDTFARHEPDTGRWFLDSPEFTKWVAGNDRTLWCPGDPGTGKTFLASISIDNLRQKFKSDDSTGVFCMYCNYKEEIAQTVTNLLGGICTQSMRIQSSISELAKSKYHSCYSEKKRPDLYIIQDLLQAEIGRYKRVFIVIDALDECLDKNNERIVLLTELRKLLALPAKVQLLFTSRPSINILSQFPDCKTLPISAREEHIRHYIKSRLPHLHNCVHRDPILQDEIIDGIVQNACGMFLLAHLDLEALKDKLTAWEIRAAIGKLPKGNDALTSAYDQALSRIDAQLEGHRNLAHRVLSWISHARRPLTVEELRHALAMAQYTTLDPSALHDPENLTAFCTGLVTIGHEDRTIRLVHYTAQSYFETIRYTRYPNAHKLIAEACLKYIDETYKAAADFEVGDPDNDTLITRVPFVPDILLTRFTFLAYSLWEWAYHVYRAVGAEEDLQSLILLLEDKEEALESCCLSFWGIEAGHYCMGTTLLMVAAAFGFECIVKKLLEQGADVNSTGPHGFTALHYAAMTFRPSIGSLLLDHGADVDARAKKGRTPLHWALGSEPMVRLLLEHGANPHRVTQHGDTPLTMALEAWEEEEEMHWRELFRTVKTLAVGWSFS